MIQYSLVCEIDHKFDAWFRNAEAFDEQSARGIVTCPVCGSGKVGKGLMAPAVARSGWTNSRLPAQHRGPTAPPPAPP